MKPLFANKKNNAKWYLVFDGRNHTVTNDIAPYEHINGVFIELTADQAATYLLLKSAEAENEQ